MIIDATEADEVENEIPAAMYQVLLLPHDVEQHGTTGQCEDYKVANKQDNDFKAI